jgi:small GTP-binding protein
MYDLCPKILLFGDVGVGKRTLAHKFLVDISQSDSKMTIGVDFYTMSLTVDEYKVKLQVWLFGSEERFRFLTPTYVIGAAGGLFIYDITIYDSIAHIDDWLTLIRKKNRAEYSFPIIIIGNKADLSEQREVSSEDGIKIAKSRGLDGFIECSVKSGENVEEAFQALSSLIIASESF